MATHDIIAFSGTISGGHNSIQSLPRDPATTYRQGEWVTLAAGVIDETAGAAGGFVFDPTIHYIAAEDGTQRLDRVGDTRYVNPPNTGLLAPVYAVVQGSEFITDNVYNGTDTLVAPTAADIGNDCGGHVTVAGVHGIDIGDTGLKIVRVLNADKKDITVAGGAGVYAVFTSDT